MATTTETKPDSRSNAPRETVTLTDNSNGKSVELKLMSGTVGPKVIDIRKLYAETGHFTFDPGYTSTGSCESKITYIDGDEGILLYRGYPIEQLAEKSDFMETSSGCTLSMEICRWSSPASLSCWMRCRVSR